MLKDGEGRMMVNEEGKRERERKRGQRVESWRREKR